MLNMTAAVKGTKLTIEIDVSEAALKSAQLSTTGKTRIVASSKGNQPIALPGGGQVIIGVNCYTK